MEPSTGERPEQNYKEFIMDPQNILDLEVELCKHFNPEMIQDKKMLYFMKRLYAKYSKVRSTTSQYLNHLEAVKNKEVEAAELKKKLLVNQDNQSKDISTMWRAVKEDISSFNKDLRNYRDDLHYLENIKINPGLVHDNKSTLADYISREDIEQSRENLESRKDALTTKMNKLNENNKTLKGIIEEMDLNLTNNQHQLATNFKLITNSFQQLRTIGKGTGLSVFEERPELLGKNDFSWGNATEDDKRLFERMSISVKISIANLEKLLNGIKALYDEYISICKRTFEQLTKINTAIGKNEGERIKTLKMYEMFKKEYKYFQTPKNLPKCYKESIIEVKRRMKYKRFLDYTLEKLKALWDYENNKRDEFLKKNGLYIPKSMIPQLGNKAPFLKCFPRESEKGEYPDTLLTESDKKINGVDSKIYYFEKVFTDILKNIDHQGLVKNSSSKDIEEYKDAIKQLKEQHESEIIRMLEPYKQEIPRIMEEKQEVQEKLKKVQQEFDDLKIEAEHVQKLRQELDSIKSEHDRCSNSDLLSQKIDALKKRNKELAAEQDNKLRQYMSQNEQHEDTLNRLNQRMKDALQKLNINIDVYDDKRFFEHAFKELCKSHYNMSKDLERLLVGAEEI